MNSELANIPPDFKVLVSGILGPEGPAIDAEGRLHVVSADDGVILSISETGEVLEVAKTGGRPNGLVFNSKNEMFVADAELKAILRIDINGEIDVLTDSYEGTSLGGPNDLCSVPNGDLLFTDPVRRPLPDPAISPVYRVTPDGKSSAFADELAYPNGIALSPNQKQVYVSETRAQRLVAFTINESCQLIDQQLIRRFREPGGPDGIAIDVEGNIFQALPGIRAIAYLNPAGKMIDLYHVPSWSPENLAFGGNDMKTLFVCGSAQNSIYQFRHSIAGTKLV